MNDNRNSEFIQRHIGPSQAEQSQMLDSLGYKSMDQFIQDVVPSSILDDKQLDLRDSAGENQSLEILKNISSKNTVNKSYIGMGYYNTFTPNVILRNILENPNFYTSYTPYQSEISQGRMEMLLNFQQMITDLTKMDIANASL